MGFLYLLKFDFVKAYLCLCFFAAIYFQACQASAEIQLPYVINNGMVLQRNSEIIIWGWSEPGEEVFVEFKGNKHQVLKAKDLGLRDSSAIWLSDESNDWMEMEEVDLWPLENNRPIHGVYWFKKEFWVDSEELAELSGKLLLGVLVDSDEAYINEVLVGSTSYRYPPRRYVIPEGVLKVGKNTLIVRMVNERGRGGFISEKPYQIEIGNQIIDLSKNWWYKIGAIMPEAPTQTTIKLKPMGLYNAMIAPLHKLPITGILWYQGESNIGQSKTYEKQFKSLIEGWREEWNRPELPFIFVQLPNFMEVVDHPQESAWAEMREAQRKSLTIPNTGMAITIDVGEANDIHPLDKKTVGDRLALQAEKLVYGEQTGPFSGPLLHKVKTKKDRLILTFTEIGDGLSTSDGDSLGGFAIAGEDGKFVWADAVIRENKVYVWTTDIKYPKKLRYAWANNPERANLVNSKGLPASPFEFPLR